MTTSTSPLRPCTPRRLAWALTVLVALPAPAFAGKKEEAKAIVANATKAHKEGRYEEALVHLEAAYALDPKPDLLYAIGQVHAKLGHCAEAITYYKRFVATQTDPQVARVVDDAIAACTSAPAAASSDGAPSNSAPQANDDEPPPLPARSPPPPDPPTSTTKPVARPTKSPAGLRAQPFVRGKVATSTAPRRAPWYHDKLGDGLVIGGVVAAAIALVQYRGALSDLDASEDRTRTTNDERHNELVDSAHSKRTISLVLAGAGAALIAGGVVRFVLRGGDTEVRTVGVAPASGGGVVTYQGRF